MPLTHHTSTNNRRRRHATRLFGVLVAASVSLAGAGPASASVPGLEHVSLASDTNSTYVKSVTVACPAGKRVLGVGGEINGGEVNGKAAPITIRELTPSADLTSATASAVEYAGGTPNAWNVEVFAVCANPVAGLTRVAVSSADDPHPKKVSAACPMGMQLVGTGAKTVLSGWPFGAPMLPGDVAIEITPEGLTGVVVDAYETEKGLDYKWTLTAYAICASPLPGLEVKSSDTGFTTAAKMVTATCSAGKAVLGTGADIIFTPHDVLKGDGEVVFNRILPATNGVLASAIPDATGTMNTWKVRSHAICATP